MTFVQFVEAILLVNKTVEFKKNMFVSKSK